MKNLAWQKNNEHNVSSSNAGTKISSSATAPKQSSIAYDSAADASNEMMNDNSNPQQGNKYTECPADTKIDERKLFVGGLPSCGKYV